MDISSRAENELLSEVDLTLEHIYEYFCVEGVEILSGKNFYHTRLYRFVRTLENLCTSISAPDIYTALRQIYIKNSSRQDFIRHAKAMLEPHIRRFSEHPTYLSTSSFTDRVHALSYPACASR